MRKLALLVLFLMGVNIYAAGRKVQCHVDNKKTYPTPFDITFNLSDQVAKNGVGKSIVTTTLGEEFNCIARKSEVTLEKLHAQFNEGKINQGTYDFLSQLVDAMIVYCDKPQFKGTIQYAFGGETDLIFDNSGVLEEMTCSKTATTAPTGLIGVDQKGPLSKAKILGNLFATCQTVYEDGEKSEFKRSLYLNGKNVYISDILGFLAQGDLKIETDKLVITYPRNVGGENIITINKGTDPRNALGTIDQGSSSSRLSCVMEF